MRVSEIGGGPNATIEKARRSIDYAAWSRSIDGARCTRGRYTRMLNVLVIGCGSIGERHARCIQQTGRANVGISETNANLASAVGARYGIDLLFEDLDTALAARKWDAAVIAAPAHVHVPIATTLVTRGVHVLCEKPLSVTYDGVDELIVKAHQAGIVAGVAYVHRAHPMLTAFRGALRSGRFGNPLQITCNAGSDFAAARPAYRTVYYADRAKGGGAVQDALSHLLDVGLWLAGPIDRIACDVSHQKLEGVTVEDTVHLIGRQGNSMCSYTLNQYQGPTELTITIVCDRGTMRYELHNNRWLWATEPGGAWNVEQFEPIARDDWFVRQENAFLDAVAGKAEVLCPLTDAATVLRTTLAALRSADRGLEAI